MAGRHLQDGGVMRLALSSAAAPDATLDELLAACARRGFAALELEEDHAHGVRPGLAAAELASAVARAAAGGIAIAAYRVGDVERAADPAAARFAAALGAPIVVRVPAAEAAAFVRRVAAPFAEAGATLLLDSAGPVTEVDHLRRLADDAGGGAVGLAWDVDPGAGALAEPGAVLAAGGAHLRHIRLRGGGPETMGQAGLGIGALMGAIALAGHPVSLAIAPSDRRFRIAWGAWLGRKRGGWGCGSKSDSENVAIGHGER